jgi:hypothetical protein
MLKRQSIKKMIMLLLRVLKPFSNNKPATSSHQGKMIATILSKGRGTTW